jgi:hypothetical protein
MGPILSAPRGLSIVEGWTMYTLCGGIVAEREGKVNKLFKKGVFFLRDIGTIP